MSVEPKSDGQRWYHSQRGFQQSKLRKVVLERDSATCIACGSKKNIEVAHIHPVVELPRGMDIASAHDPRLAICLCNPCHRLLDGNGLPPHRQAEFDSLKEERTRIREERLRGTDCESKDRAIGRQMKQLFTQTKADAERVFKVCCLYLGARYHVPDVGPIDRALIQEVFRGFLGSHMFWFVPFAEPQHDTSGWSYSAFARLFYPSEEHTEPTDAMLKHGHHVPDPFTFIAEREEQKQAKAARAHAKRKATYNKLVRRWRSELRSRYQAILSQVVDAPKTVRQLQEAIRIMDENAIRATVGSASFSLTRLDYIRRQSTHDASSAKYCYAITDRGLRWITSCEMAVPEHLQLPGNPIYHDWPQVSTHAH